MMQGGGGGGSNEGSMSTVSKAEVVEQDYVGLSEVSSYPSAHVNKRGVEDEAELELGLGLSLGGVKLKQCAPADYCRILTAKDFCGVLGTKRAVDSVSQEVGSNVASNQVVGWPPIRAYRMNNLVNQARVPAEDHNTQRDSTEKTTLKINNTKNNININNNNNIKIKGHVSSLFVKVNMDGVPIGRKVDLVANGCYETLAKALEDMFQRPSIHTLRSSGAQSGFENEHGMVVEGTKPSKLLDGSSKYVLTYEDKEGDWMLVGDVPWGMFLSTVKRLRIMKTSEANGLAPRFQEQRRKPL